MAYVTDFTKTPIQMVLGLINSDNNKGYQEADTEFLAPVVLTTPDADGRDTSVELDLTALPSEVDNDYVTFKYKRVGLGELFGQFSPSFREVDVPLNENGLPASASGFYAELLRKFGVNMSEADFDYSLSATPGVITIAAKETNLAYTGSFDITVQNSMSSRVATTTLDGFNAPA